MMASRLPTEDGRLIDDVFARKHIEKLIEETEQDKKKGKGLFAWIGGHPLTAIFFAAVPLIVFSVTLFKDGRIRREANLSAERANYQSQIDKFSSDILSRTNRSILLYYALKESSVNVRKAVLIWTNAGSIFGK